MAWKDSSDKQESLEALEREMARRVSRGETFAVFEAPKGHKLAGNFWGQAWQRHLESYADYESRLPRGRSCLRQGKVFNLAVEPGEVTAVVAGEVLHDVIVKIVPLKAEHWAWIKEQCAGQIGTLLDLLGGKVNDSVLKIITDKEEGLFPKPKEIKVICDCVDSAGLCQHGAAVLYAIGLKFDAEPSLFFKLRKVNPEELLSLAVDVVGREPAAGEASVIADEDLSALFGIDLDG